MIVPPGLDFLREIVREHVEDRGTQNLLLPCLHEELEEDVPLLEAAALRCNGTLFDLTCAEADWVAPAGPISPDRQGVLEGLLNSEGGTLPRKVLIEDNGAGAVVARLDGEPLPAEPSLVPLLRAAAVIASSAYDEYEFVILAAMTSPADPNRRELLWNLLTLDPTCLGLAEKRTTLVPILGANLDPDIDYLRDPELRYVVRWDRLIRRSTRTIDQAIKNVADIGERPIVLFFGAGASASAKIPLGNRYRDTALKRFIDDKQADDAPGAFYDLLREQGRLYPSETSRSGFVSDLTLERVLLEIFRDLGVRPRTDAAVIQEIVKDCETALNYVRPGRRATRELARLLPGQLIIMTVNFDELIETDLGTPSNVMHRPEHFSDGQEDLVSYAKGDKTKPIPILKLHGSISEPDSLIATIDTTSAGLHDDVRAALNALLDATEGPLTWVWIGCSMRDRDMNSWLGGLSSNALDEWWVDPMPGQPLHTFFEEKRAPTWRQRNQRLEDRLIIDSADNFLRSLHKQITSA